MAITPELTKYVTEARQKGMSEEIIRQELLKAGWNPADVYTVLTLTMSEPPQTILRSPLQQETPVMQTVATPTHKGFLTFVVTAILFLIIGGSVYFFRPQIFLQFKGEPVTTNMIQEVSNTDINSSTNDRQAQFHNITTDEAWKIFDQYVLALQSVSQGGNLNTLNKVVYKAQPSCPTGSENQCKQMGSFLYESVKNFDKIGYVNIFADERQIILSTELKRNDQNAPKISYIGYERGYLFFAKDQSGVLKLVSVNPSREWNVTKTATDPEQTLNKMVKDSDNDGITDQEETCTGASEFNKKCVKTDPQNKDSDGDGLWDGIEANIR